VTSTDRFELVGRLYYSATGYLRPGKSEPLETGRDANSDENRERFENYCATRLLNDLLTALHEAEIDRDAARGDLDDLQDSLGRQAV
jgi:hypothetical protein